MNLTVAQLFAEAAKKLRAEFEFIRSNPHAGEKGAEAETVVQTFLNHHLPQRFRATSGITIDKFNSLSPQTDVIIYDALTSPVYRYSEQMLMLPLDTVAAVIEVKSRLNKKEIEDGYKKIAACKRLKKTPVSAGDQQATGSDLATVATYGVIFGFSSDTSLATLAQHAEELNAQYEPSAWPDLIVLLDSGTIGYYAQFPGGTTMGHMMPPTSDTFAVPPMTIYLMLNEDGEFTLNQFFILLLSHLTFYPRRIGTPPFEQILQGANNTCTNLKAYQYNRDRELLPVPEAQFKERANIIPLTISITDDKGTPRGLLRYFPWIDGGVLAWSGALPLPPLLMPLGDIGLKMMVNQGEVHYSNPLTLTEAEFRQWPERLNKSLKGLRAQLAGFVLKHVFNEGRSEPFVARLMAGMFDIKDRALITPQERHAFDIVYRPVIENLIEARRMLRQKSGITDSIGIAGDAPSPAASFETLANAALQAVPGLFEFFKHPVAFMFEPDAAFNEGVAALYAHDPVVATYLLGCRSDWLKKWIDAREGRPTGDVEADSVEPMSTAFGRIAALIENLCVHLFGKNLAKSLAIVEIVATKRNPDYPRRFEMLLATEGVIPWTLEYRPTGFGDQ